MADWNDPKTRQTGFGASPSLNGEVAGREIFDAGLRKHMLSIYNYMASGVLLTGIVSLLFAQSGYAEAMLLNGGIMSWVIMLAPLGFVLAMSFAQNKFSTAGLQAMFWGFAIAMGLSISYIFFMYTMGSIAATFFATAGAFAGLSLFGYTTKKDLSAMGTFLVMGVIGLIIAMLLNAFIFQSEGFDLAISFIGVLIFAGLTAWDTQRLKSEYISIQNAKMTNPAIAQAFPMGKLVVMGALTLYLDFINMFLFLLRFMGSRE